MQGVLFHLFRLGYILTITVVSICRGDKLPPTDLSGTKDAAQAVLPQGDAAQLGEALVAAGIQTVLCWESEASHLPPAPHSLHHHE